MSEMKNVCKDVNVNGHKYIREDLAHGQNSEEDALSNAFKSGIKALVGNRVLLICCNYFYEGYLECITTNEREYVLTDAAIVYETGPWTEKNWKDRQCLPGPVGGMISAIESYQQAPNLIV